MLLYGVEHLLRFELGDERSSRTETEGNSRITGVARPKRQGSGSADNVVFRDSPAVLPEAVGHDQQFLHKVDGPFRASSCAGSVHQQTHVLAVAEHWIDGWIAALHQFAVGEESFGLHLGGIAPDDDDVFDRLKILFRTFDLAQKRSADDDGYRLRVVGDVSDLVAREQG